MSANDTKLIAEQTIEIVNLRLDRAEAKHYAAVLYAITHLRPDMPVEERQALASAIVATQRERGLID
jgi:hypothetical protein